MYAYLLLLKKHVVLLDYSSSSSSDYSSDSESPWEDDSILLEDEGPGEKPVRAQLNPRANRMDDPKLNPNIKVRQMSSFLLFLTINNPFNDRLWI